MEELNTLDKVLLGTAGTLAVSGGYFIAKGINTYTRLKRYWVRCAEIRAINAEHEANKISLREYGNASLDY